MLKSSKNRIVWGILAALPLFALGIALGAQAAAADEDGVHSEATTHIEAGDNEDTSTSSSTGRGLLRDLKGDVKDIKNVIKEKDDEENASTSTSTRDERDHGLLSGKFKGDFAATLSADRIAALAELKKGEDGFSTRMNGWRQKLASSTAEFRVKLKDDKKAAVQSTLVSILNRFITISNELGNVSGRLSADINGIQTNKHIDMSASTNLLATADAKLSLAKSDILSASSSVRANLDATTTSADLKSAIETAKSSLTDAYNAYKDVIKSIRIQEDAHATTRATTTP